MPTKTLKCAGCKERFNREEMIKLPAGNFHSMNCAIQYANKKSAKTREAAARTKNRQDKEKIKSRTEWLYQLQKLVNQYVSHVRDKDKPCCTCGTTASIKYDAGHFRSRGSCPELRFELTNIHKQCSIRCNVHGSGMRREYAEFIATTYGKDHLDWLEGPHDSLKKQFPDIESIKKEIIRYRQLIRESGLKPAT